MTDPASVRDSAGPPAVDVAWHRRALQSVSKTLFVGDVSLFVLFVLVLVYYAATPGIFEGKASGDGLFGFMHLPALFLHGTLDLRATMPDRVGQFGLGLTGRAPNPCPIGPDLFWIPSYLLGLLLQKLHILHGSKAVHGPELGFGKTPVDFWMAGLGTVLYVTVGIAALYRLLVRHVSIAAARFGVWLSALATPVCFYVVTQPLYQHGASFATVALLIERWEALLGAGDPEKTAAASWRDYALLGALCGLAMLTRMQEGIWLLLPAISIAESLIGALRRRDDAVVRRLIVHGLCVLLFAFLVFSPQLAVWRYYYGMFSVPQPRGHMRWLEPALVETLFSLRSGLFPWVPVLYLAVPGLLLRPLRKVSLRLLPLFLFELWINASAWDFHGSWAFGPRRFTDAMAIFAVGLAALYEALRGQRSRRALVVVATALVLYNVLLMELVRTRRIKSSSAGAYPFATWVTLAKGPAWLSRVFATVGYPFAQPASAIYAALYRIPPAAVEGILGNYFLERDWRVRSAVTLTYVPLVQPSTYYFPASGVDAQAVGQRGKVIIPLYTQEPMRVHLSLSSADLGEPTATWNGHPLSFLRRGARLQVDLPRQWVHSRAWWNELRIEAPPGQQVLRVDLQSIEKWW